MITSQKEERFFQKMKIKDHGNEIMHFRKKNIIISYHH